MDNASGNKPEVDRAAYDRYKALMQRKFDESAHTTNYAAKYKILNDANDARKEQAKAEAENTRRSVAPAHSQDTTATSDSDDPSAALQAFNPRKQRIKKESSE